MKYMPSKLLLSGALLFMGSSGAIADPIGPDCETCQGSIYELTYSEVNGNTYDVNLEIDTTGYTGSTTNYIDTVAFLIGGNLTDPGTLTDAPGGLTAWESLEGPVANNGCQDANGNWVCAQQTGAPGDAVAQADGSTYNWTWSSVIVPDLQTGELEASLGVRYLDENGQFVGPIVSEMITLQPANGNGNGVPVPEPAPLALLIGGLAGLGMTRRLRSRS